MGEIEGHPDPLRDGASRRRFVQLAGGTAALSAFLAACGSKVKTPPPGEAAPNSSFGPGDEGILNFTLLLEEVQVAFYRRANDSGEIRGRRARQVMLRIEEEERDHAESLRSLIELSATAPVNPPRTNFDAVVVGGERTILAAGARLENVGVASYLAQLPRLQGKSNISLAATAHTVEARHAAALNELAGRGFRGGRALEGTIPNGALARPMPMGAVLREINAFIVT